MFPGDCNPHTPQIPGSAGLFLCLAGLDRERARAKGTLKEDETEYRLLTPAKYNNRVRWQYMGVYKRLTAPSLTKDEWNSQKESVSAFLSTLVLQNPL